MSDKTKIEWTDATKRCSDCRTVKSVSEFAKDRSRADALTYRCRDCRNARSRATHTRSTRVVPIGRRFVPARDGDVRQARRRVNYLVDAGLIPDPNDLPCADCLHVWMVGERRHEYDHHLGYEAIHHEDVEPVCSSCHHRREDQRRAA